MGQRTDSSRLFVCPVAADWSAVSWAPAWARPWPGHESQDTAPHRWPQLTTTVDLTTVAPARLLPPRFGALRNAYPLPNSWRADLTLFISQNKTQPRGGWALGWEGLPEGKAPFPGTPSTSGVNPTGKGSGEEGETQRQTHRDGEGQRQDRGRTAEGEGGTGQTLGQTSAAWTAREGMGHDRRRRPEAGRRVSVGAGPRAPPPCTRWTSETPQPHCPAAGLPQAGVDPDPDPGPGQGPAKSQPWGFRGGLRRVSQVTGPRWPQGGGLAPPGESGRKEAAGAWAAGPQAGEQKASVPRQLPAGREAGAGGEASPAAWAQPTLCSGPGRETVLSPSIWVGGSPDSGLRVSFNACLREPRRGRSITVPPTGSAPALMSAFRAAGTWRNIRSPHLRSEGLGRPPAPSSWWQPPTLPPASPLKTSATSGQTRRGRSLAARSSPDRSTARGRKGLFVLGGSGMYLAAWLRWHPWGHEAHLRKPSTLGQADQRGALAAAAWPALVGYLGYACLPGSPQATSMSHVPPGARPQEQSCSVRQLTTTCPAQRLGSFTAVPQETAGGNGSGVAGRLEMGRREGLPGGQVRGHRAGCPLSCGQKASKGQGA